MLRLAPTEVKAKEGLSHELQELNRLLTKYPWPELQRLKGDEATLEQIEETLKLLSGLKDVLS